LKQPALTLLTFSHPLDGVAVSVREAEPLIVLLGVDVGNTVGYALGAELWDT